MRNEDITRNPDIPAEGYETQEPVQAALERARASGKVSNEDMQSRDAWVVDSDSEKRMSKNTSEKKKEQNERWRAYKPVAPKWLFEIVVLPEKVKKIVMREVDSITVAGKVYEEWGLKRIVSPRSAINFFGMPGTGKTMTAHAVAHYLERDILLASYAEIESMYHGEGPKNIKAVFEAAEKYNAVLLIDEADSLLSKRLTQVKQGSEQAINSMRSQLLMSLEDFTGIVIFCTNLIENYDKAFESRIISVEFPLPDEECRKNLWNNLLVPETPRSDDVDCEFLAKKYDDVSGRDIRNAIRNAAVSACLAGMTSISLKLLTDAMDEIIESRFDNNDSQGLSDATKEDIGRKIKKRLSKEKRTRRQKICRY